MRVLMISKACLVGQYQSKLEALARYRDVELTAVVPPYWQDERGILAFERAYTRGYTLRIENMSLNGHFHLHYYPTLPALIDTFAPEIVHIDEEPYNFATLHALRAARKVGAQPVFFTWQNILRRYPPPFGLFEWYVLSHSRFAIAGSQQAAAVLSAKHYRGPTRVIPQFGVDPEQFTPRRDARPAKRPLQIGFVGRLVPEKGVHILLKAVSQLKGDWVLNVLGSGPCEAELKLQAEHLDIAGHICWQPWRASTEMPKFYRELDVLVAPSLTRPNWKEQFGRVLIEAMAAEVPVIGSDCGEIPNVIGNAGLVFQEGDPIALHDRIESLSDPARRAELGHRGRERVLKHYTQEHVAHETYTVYQAIAGASTQL